MFKHDIITDMKQEIPVQNLQPEHQSISYEHNPEHLGGLTNNELSTEKRVEQHDQKSENAAVASEISLTTALPTPIVTSAAVDGITTYNNNPPVAGDDDLIEKAWVEKAKEIVAETRDNPHKRDEAVGKLQVDYLNKRYGRKLGVTG
jgi:hypothetical protein